MAQWLKYWTRKLLPSSNIPSTSLRHTHWLTRPHTRSRTQPANDNLFDLLQVNCIWIDYIQPLKCGQSTDIAGGRNKGVLTGLVKAEYAPVDAACGQLSTAEAGSVVGHSSRHGYNTFPDLKDLPTLPLWNALSYQFVEKCNVGGRGIHNIICPWIGTSLRMGP